MRTEGQKRKESTEGKEDRTEGEGAPQMEIRKGRILEGEEKIQSPVLHQTEDDVAMINTPSIISCLLTVT